MYNEIAGRPMTSEEILDQQAQWKAQRRLDLLRMVSDITRDTDPDYLIRTAERFEAWSEGKPQS